VGVVWGLGGGGGGAKFQCCLYRWDFVDLTYRLLANISYIQTTLLTWLLTQCAIMDAFVRYTRHGNAAKHYTWNNFFIRTN